LNRKWRKKKEALIFCTVKWKKAIRAMTDNTATGDDDVTWKCTVSVGGGWS
jgi:hypothetical protein